MLIHQITLNGLLSFGPESSPIDLQPLNVLIGPNGSGKSNLVEAISLLRSSPKNLSAPVKEAGGVSDWLWKGAPGSGASIEAIIDNKVKPDMPIRHFFSFAEHGMRFEVTAERIENKEAYPGHDQPNYIYRMEGGHPRLKELDTEGPGRPLPRETINPEESILSQIRDPERYPLLTYLSECYKQVRIYREWSFGRYTQPRQPQKADLPTAYLTETCENLALVLNSMRPKSKQVLLASLQSLYPGIDDFNVQIQNGWVQLYLEEGRFSIPASRLSDGTLRYLCLLAVLCHPDPPPLVCIEEPELGLHPDVLPELARLMISASERSQLIVTTHSDILVDALTEDPESVLVCEKHGGQTQIKRLDSQDLSRWLERYRLGQLWLKGQLGGTRW